MISRFLGYLSRVASAIFCMMLLLGFGFAIWGALSPLPPTPPIPVEPRHPDLLLMDAVRRISADASTLMLSPIRGVGMDEPGPCMLARTAVGHPDLPSSASKAWRSECALGTMLRKSTDPVFHAIEESRTLPRKAFVFDAYVEERWSTLGLFADSGTCAQVLESAMLLGIGVRSCVPWSPRF